MLLVMVSTCGVKSHDTMDTRLSAIYQISFVSLYTGHKSAFYYSNPLFSWKGLFLTPSLKVISP